MATTNSMVDTVSRIVQNNDDFVTLAPQINLYQSLIAALIDRMVTAEPAQDIVDSLEVDESVRKSLNLCLRSIHIRDINGQHGHLIERKLLIDALPPLEEMPEVAEKLLKALRERHQRALLQDGPAEAKQFHEDFASALRQHDISRAEKILYDECGRLHERIMEIGNGVG